jgi:hypothetical protein
MGRLAYGDPSWRINIDGGWDAVPLLLALGFLLVLKVVFRVRIRWYLALGVVLAAPLFRAFADRVGMPVAVGLALLILAVVVPAARRSGRPGPPTTSA